MARRNAAPSPRGQFIATLDQMRVTLDQLEVLARSHLSQPYPDRFTAFGLTKVELRIAEIVFSQPGKIITRLAIVEAVYWDSDSPKGWESISTKLCLLRKKLARSKYKIETAWGVGLRGIIS